MNHRPPRDTPRLADCLAEARLRLMVGRKAEIQLFKAALGVAVPAYPVLHVHGPGGIGKTTLLRHFQWLAQRAARPVAWVDGRDTDPSPDAFHRQVRQQLAGNPAPEQASLQPPPNLVLLIDSYEQMAPLDTWLRECLLPELPAGNLVVLAGRDPPAAQWRNDIGWSALSRSLMLRNLRPEESRRYLSLRNVAQSHHEPILSFTHGHPLALTLMADVLEQQDPGATFAPGSQHAVINTLLDRLLSGMPGPEHRHALEVSAHARFTTEALLADVLDESERAPALFGWLRSLSVMDQGEQGLRPHDLVREALDADLRWRDPDRYRSLHRRVRDHVIRRFRASHGSTQREAFFDLLYLHRHAPSMRPYYDWKFSGQTSVEAASSADHPAIVALVRRRDGDREADLARYWLQRQPQAFSLFLGWQREIVGATQLLVLRSIDTADLEADPALRSAFEHTRREAPLRAGEALLLQRFWPARRGALGTAAYNTLALVSTRCWLSTPALAWAFVVTPVSEALEPMFNHLGFGRLEKHAPEPGYADCVIYGRDWRTESPIAWLEGLAERELATAPADATRSLTPAPTRLVLSEPDFALAVRQALKDFHHPEALTDNPLLRSRLLLENTAHTPTAADLQALLRGALERLRNDARGEKRYRALWQTYIQPAQSQERVAERLQLPFNTYRYQLYQGTDQLISLLWHRELYGGPSHAATDSS